jgi:hypothetical protein
MKVCIPKGDRHFWGSEYLSKNAYITLEDAYERLLKYVSIHSLQHQEGFTLDTTLQEILHTDALSVQWKDLPALLQRIQKF